MNLSERMETVDNVASWIGKLAGYLGSEHYPSGDRVALKRIASGKPLPLAYYRLWLLHFEGEPPEPENSWAILVWGLALMGNGAHRPDRGLGQALAECKFSESRIEQMLAASESIREDIFVRVVRFLAAKKEGFNWLDAAFFLLTKNADKRESIHRKIAADFYRNLPKDH